MSLFYDNLNNDEQTENGLFTHMQFNYPYDLTFPKCNGTDYSIDFENYLIDSNDNMGVNYNLKELNKQYNINVSTDTQSLVNDESKSKSQNIKSEYKKIKKNLDPIIKQQLKMEKNRQSAKKSRDKLKKKFEDLENTVKLLTKENVNLKNQNYALLMKMNTFSLFFNKSACSSCTDNLPNDLKLYIDNAYNEQDNLYISSSNDRINSSNSNGKQLPFFICVLFMICMIIFNVDKASSSGSTKSMYNLDLFSTSLSLKRNLMQREENNFNLKDNIE